MLWRRSWFMRLCLGKCFEFGSAIKLTGSDGHCSTINRLAFRPTKDGLMLASSSEDRSFRLFTLVQ